MNGDVYMRARLKLPGKLPRIHPGYPFKALSDGNWGFVDARCVVVEVGVLSGGGTRGGPWLADVCMN